MEKWKNIWNNKGKGANITSIQDLINANGYETSGLNEKNLKDFIDKQIEKLKIVKGDSVYEIGCGSGTILSLLHDKGVLVGGCDYSESLIEICKSLKVSDDVSHKLADQISIEPQYDFVISMGVFHYFPDLEYVTKVTELMLKKAKRRIAILDLNDEDKRDLYFEIRRAHEPDYDKKYEGMDHLFINKQFWIDFSNKRGLKLIIEDQKINGYKNEKFRYNIYLKK